MKTIRARTKTRIDPLFLLFSDLILVQVHSTWSKFQGEECFSKSCSSHRKSNDKRRNPETIGLRAFQSVINNPFLYAIRTCIFLPVITIINLTKKGLIMVFRKSSSSRGCRFPDCSFRVPVVPKTTKLNPSSSGYKWA